MFIGEMGSWIVVFGFFLYRRYVSPRLSSGASPLLAGGYLNNRLFKQLASFGIRRVTVANTLHVLLSHPISY